MKQLKTKQQTLNELNEALDALLLKHFEEKRGKWLDRNKVMKACGFDSPDEHPVGAYVQFSHSLNRVNREIAQRGLSIVRDEAALDFFALVNAGTYGE